MNYVIDASVVIEYLIVGRFTPNAKAFFEQVTDADLLTIPEFCLLECTNVIWKHVRFNNMPRDSAHELLKVLRSLKLRRVPMKRLLARALDIALDNTLAVYDAGYVALALYYGCPLITIDAPQSRAATAEGAILKSITDFSP